MDMIPLEVETVLRQYLFHFCSQGFFLFVFQNLNSEILRQVELRFWETELSSMILTIACLFMQARIHSHLVFSAGIHLSVS